MEGQNTHSITQEDIALIPKSWAEFVSDFSQEAANYRQQPQKSGERMNRRTAERIKWRRRQETRLARAALDHFTATAEDKEDSSFIEDFHEYLDATEVSDWQREKLRNFIDYFEAIDQGEDGQYQREAIHKGFISQAKSLLSQYNDALGDTNHETRLRRVQALNGFASEVAFGALMSHPHSNLSRAIAVPALGIQDASSQARRNHDYLYVSAYNQEVQTVPTQVKTSLTNYDGGDRETTTSSFEKYDTDVAVIVASEDLHVCRVAGDTDCQASACIVRDTLNLIVSPEIHPQGDQILDTLRNGLLLKLSSWETYHEEWRTVLEKQRTRIRPKRAKGESRSTTQQQPQRTAAAAMQQVHLASQKKRAA